jgi:hypothetical protein
LKKVFVVGIVIFLAGLNIAPAHGASTTFYLNLKVNSCYSFTKAGTKPVSIDNNIKALFPVSCKKPHHIQVIKAAQVPSSNSLLTQDEMSAYCSAAYNKKFGVPAPTSIANNAIYLRWYFPDAGVETRKYKKKGICLVHKSDANYSVYSVLRKKL